MFFELSACPTPDPIIAHFQVSRTTHNSTTQWPSARTTTLLYWRSQLGGFSGLMLRRAEFCSWCYLQLILTMTKPFPHCTSLSQCLVHWGPDSAQIFSYIKFPCAKLSKAVYFWRTEALRLKGNVYMVNQKRSREEAKGLAPSSPMLAPCLCGGVQSDLNRYKS